MLVDVHGELVNLKERVTAVRQETDFICNVDDTGYSIMRFTIQHGASAVEKCPAFSRVSTAEVSIRVLLVERHRNFEVSFPDTTQILRFGHEETNCILLNVPGSRLWLVRDPTSRPNASVD
jgi:hypothetical protein